MPKVICGAYQMAFPINQAEDFSPAWSGEQPSRLYTGGVAGNMSHLKNPVDSVGVSNSTGNTDHQCPDVDACDVTCRNVAPLKLHQSHNPSRSTAPQIPNNRGKPRLRVAVGDTRAPCVRRTQGARWARRATLALRLDHAISLTAKAPDQNALRTR